MMFLPKHLTQEDFHLIFQYNSLTFVYLGPSSQHKQENNVLMKLVEQLVSVCIQA